MMSWLIWVYQRIFWMTTGKITCQASSLISMRPGSKQHGLGRILTSTGNMVSQCTVLKRAMHAGYLTGIEVIRLNTLYSGSCFAIYPPQNLTSRMQIENMKVNLNRNISWATLYLLPQESTNAVILDEWHYPVKKLKLHNLKFMENVLTKEYHIMWPTKESPCIDMSEATFYEVR